MYNKKFEENEKYIIQEASQYESMLRLVAAHRASLLEATRRHVAQALHAAGDLRSAETYYVQAGMEMLYFNEFRYITAFVTN